MKVLVTGGAGYVGSVTVAHLIKAGHKVIVLDNLFHSDKNSLVEGTQFIEGDIKDLATLVARDDAIDAVIHCAGLIAAGESVVEPAEYWDVNVTGSLALLNTMRDLHIPRIIFSSSAAVYGTPKTVPITEEAVTDPINPYGMTKLVIDMAITSYCAAYNIAGTSVRYFNVAGAEGGLGERHKIETHIIPLALAAAAEGKELKLFGDDYPTRDGTCIRDYIHVSDLARAHVLALEKLTPGEHSVYNLGNGNGFSNREIIDTVQRVTGKELKLTIEERREGDPAELIASSERAKQGLGWEPQVKSIDTIIGDAWEFYQRTHR